MLNFGLIGAGGYVAPRHMQAIKDTGNVLKVALDPNDSVGVLDRYFPECKFFTNQERFDRHCVKNEKLDYLVVCSPNYLHEAHCKMGMRLGADVICEKPLSTTTENLLQLKKVEEQTKKKVYSILQLRLHPSIILAKKMLNDNYHEVILDYITPRGPWYFHSWKGNERQSGGIETNIGIHFFDMLIWLFGDVEKFDVHFRSNNCSKGELFLQNAHISWYLSLKKESIPEKSLSFYRSMTIDEDIDIRFDNVFSDLHTDSYREILSGNGFGIDDSFKAIELVEKIRETK